RDVGLTSDRDRRHYETGDDKTSEDSSLHGGPLFLLCHFLFECIGENMLRQRTLRAARLGRQSGKRLGGPSPGQVTDLTGAVPTCPERRFPARRAVRRAACFRLKS